MPKDVPWASPIVALPNGTVAHLLAWEMHERVLIASPAAVAVWGGWTGLGSMCGFGVIHLLPGVTLFGLAKFQLDSAITLPIAVKAYAAYAMGAWLTGTTGKARIFARNSAIGALVLGMLGQVAFHCYRPPMPQGHRSRSRSWSRACQSSPSALPQV